MCAGLELRLLELDVVALSVFDRTVERLVILTLAYDLDRD